MNVLSRALSSQGWRAVFIVLTLVVFVQGVSPRSHADSPVVEALLFYSETCPHCEVVRDEVLPGVLDKYGDQLEIKELNIAEPRNFELLLGFETMYQIPEDEVGIPELFVGSNYLIGDTPIAEQLEGLIDTYLAQGGVAYPVLSRDAQMTVDASRANSTPVEPARSPEPEQAVAEFYLFWDNQCDPCIALNNETLPDMLAPYTAGQVAVHSYDIQHGGYDLMRTLERHLGLEVGAMPEVFIGNEVLLGIDEIKARLPELLEHYLAQGGVALPVPEVSAVSQTPVAALDGQTGDKTAGNAPLATQHPVPAVGAKWVRWVVSGVAILCWGFAIVSFLNFVQLLRRRPERVLWRLPDSFGRWVSWVNLGAAVVFLGIGVALLLVLSSGWKI